MLHNISFAKLAVRTKQADTPTYKILSKDCFSCQKQQPLFKFMDLLLEKEVLGKNGSIFMTQLRRS